MPAWRLMAKRNALILLAVFLLPLAAATSTMTATPTPSAPSTTMMYPVPPPMAEAATIAKPYPWFDGGAELHGNVCAKWSEDDSWCGPGLAGATITLRLADGTTKATPTDSGWFSFGSIPAGRVTLLAERVGFGTTERTVNFPDESYVELILPSTTVDLSGKVVDEKGNPLSGVQVSLDGGPKQRIVTSARDGTFGATMPSNAYWVRAESAGRLTYERNFVVDGEKALVVKLPQLPPHDAWVEGRLTDQKGNSLPDMPVELYQWEAMHRIMEQLGETEHHYGSPPMRATTDETGRFRASIYSGSIEASVWADGFTSASGHAWVEPGQTVTIDLQMFRLPEPSVKITGKVIDASTGKPIPGARIEIQHLGFDAWECINHESDDMMWDEPMPMPRPMIVGVDSDTATEIAGAQPGGEYGWTPSCITIRSDGTFSGTMMPDVFILRAYADAWHLCPKDESGCPSYFAAARTLRAAENQEIDIVMKLHPAPRPNAFVAGRITDADTGAGVAGVSIDVSGPSGYFSAHSDEAGNYRVAVVPGHYEINTWSDRYHQWVSNVLVAPDSTAGVDAQLYPGASRGCCYRTLESMHDDGPFVDKVAPAPMRATDGRAQTSGAVDALGVGGRSGHEDAELEEAELQPLPVAGLGVFALLGLLGLLVLTRRR
jgi:hypothetical protein